MDHHRSRSRPRPAVDIVQSGYPNVGMTESQTSGMDPVSLIDQTPEFFAQSVQRRFGVNPFGAQPIDQRFENRFASVIFEGCVKPGQVLRFDHKFAGGFGSVGPEQFQQLGL